jgi:hypothetical protein
VPTGPIHLSVAQPPTEKATYAPSTPKLLGGILVLLWGLGVVNHSLFGVHGGAGNPYAMGARFAGLAGLVLVAIGARMLWFEFRARRS